MCQHRKLLSIRDISWIDIDDERPQYYKTVSVQLHDGTEHRVWRASDGENEIYTIDGSNNIINEQEIKQWKI